MHYTLNALNAVLYKSSWDLHKKQETPNVSLKEKQTWNWVLPPKEILFIFFVGCLQEKYCTSLTVYILQVPSLSIQYKVGCFKQVPVLYNTSSTAATYCTV